MSSSIRKNSYLCASMTGEIKNKIIPINSFIDEAFDAKKTASFELILQIGLDSLLLTVRDKSKNKYIALENYTFQNVYNFDVVSDLLAIVAKESKLIAHHYKSVVCLITNNLSTLVPNPLFKEEKKQTYLTFNTSIDNGELIIVDDLKNIEAKNIFALPTSIKSKLDELFKHITYHHASSILINSLMVANKNKTTKKLYIHFQAAHFEIMVIKGKELLFYNTFNYHSAEDFIYYLLFVCEQLHLNPETIDVVLLGGIEKNSTIYTIAQKYIRNLKFGERTDGADYSYQLQTLPKHSYFTLFNNYIA
jgi:hypothetical protein